MEPFLLARVAREIPRARTIKLEDPPTPLKTSRILAETSGVEMDILGGLGGVYLIEELISGASGVMTGFAYPEVLIEVVRAFQAGKVRLAADTFYRHVPLMRFEFQQGIGVAIRKEILRRRGVLADASIQSPGPVPDAATLASLDRILEWMRDKGASV